MRRYIKVLGVILLVVNVIVFGILVVNRETIITRNQAYEKVYPCNTIDVVLPAIDVIGESSSSLSQSESTTSYQAELEKAKYEPKEPRIRKAERIDSDLIYIIAILGIFNIVLVGTTYLLFLIVSNISNNRPDLSLAFTSLLAVFLIGSVFGCNAYFKFISQPGKVVREVHYNAPIIYLYDDQEREATVKLDLNGELTCIYPRYNEETGWVVKTSSDGVLTDKSGRQYEYLYWEADVDMEPDLSRGFCVKGEDSIEFLEKALSDLGLTDTEANAFIMYWLPQLEENPYNVITFQGETYENVAKLNVAPLPDTVVRVNMLFYGSDDYVEIEEQDLTSMNPSVSEREGFVLVEWGGGKLE